MVTNTQASDNKFNWGPLVEGVTCIGIAEGFNYSLNFLPYPEVSSMSVLPVGVAAFAASIFTVVDQVAQYALRKLAEKFELNFLKNDWTLRVICVLLASAVVFMASAPLGITSSGGLATIAWTVMAGKIVGLGIKELALARPEKNQDKIS